MNLEYIFLALVNRLVCWLSLSSNVTSITSTKHQLHEFGSQLLFGTILDRTARPPACSGTLLSLLFNDNYEPLLHEVWVDLAIVCHDKT